MSVDHAPTVTTMELTVGDVDFLDKFLGITQVSLRRKMDKAPYGSAAHATAKEDADQCLRLRRSILDIQGNMGEEQG